MGSKKKKNKLNKESSDPTPPPLPPQPQAQDSKGKKKRGKFKGGDDEGELITDPRFASVHWDPRFQNIPKRTSKFEIDSRFEQIFTDKRFGSSSVAVDKRGKPKKLDDGNKLRRYYRIEDDEGKANEDEGKVKPKEEESESEELELAGSESESESEPESEDDVAASGETDMTDTGTDDEDYDDEAVVEDGVPGIEAEDVPEIEEETHRLAIVNLDWRHVKAVDLYAVLRSFLPKGGEIKSVAVYPSEFGLERMKEEELHGPVGLFDEENEKSDEDEDEDKDEDDDDDGDEELDAQKLRAYELTRMRYYFAVVVCDSSATADYLYKNCDGVEFERSSNKLDLRFIPDSMEFKHPPRDVATQVPASYVGLDFQTQALQQSKIDISWDEDDPARKTLKRKFTDDQISEMELIEYLASDSSESDEDEIDDAAEDKSNKKSKKRDMYRSLLLSGDGDGDADGDASDRDGEDNDQDMEITFNTGLEDISKRILEKKDKESETVWEAYLRKRREKKKARKNRSKDSSEDESSDTDKEATEDADDFFIDEEPKVKKSKKGSHGKSKKEEKKHQETDKEAEASRNELELLLADDKGADTGIKGYNIKPKKTKGKKGKEVIQEDTIPDVDLDDPRFAALFKSPRFSLDPTDPRFKRTGVYARQMALRQQKVHQEEVEEKEVKSGVVPSTLEKSSLIKSIKMKSMPFNGKTTKKEEKLQSKGMKAKKNTQEPPTTDQPLKKKKKTNA